MGKRDMPSEADYQQPADREAGEEVLQKEQQRAEEFGRVVKAQPPTEQEKAKSVAINEKKIAKARALLEGLNISGGSKKEKPKTEISRDISDRFTAATKGEKHEVNKSKPKRFITDAYYGKDDQDKRESA